MGCVPTRVRGYRKKLARVASLQASGQLDTTNAANDESEFDEALAAFGFQSESEDESPVETVYLWPCNVRTWRIWNSIQTQWRSSGMGGRDGLDYASVIAYLHDVVRIKQRDFAETFAGLQAMEYAALCEYAKKRDKE